MFVADRVDKNNKIPENTPHSVAVALFILLLICHLNVSKREINLVSEISEVTINKCYKKLLKIHEEIKLIPECLIQKYGNC